MSTRIVWSCGQQQKIGRHSYIFTNISIYFYVKVQHPLSAVLYLPSKTWYWRSHYTSKGRKYIQTPGWPLGGALYCGKKAGWEGDLPLRVWRVLPFRAAKADGLPGRKPKTAAAGLYDDGQRAFVRLAGGKQPA